MTVKKFTISVPEELYAAIERRARDGGSTISAWVADAVRHELGLAAMDDAIAAYEVEHGPIPDEAVDSAMAELAAAQERSKLRYPGVNPREAGDDSL